MFQKGLVFALLGFPSMRTTFGILVAVSCLVGAPDEARAEGSALPATPPPASIDPSPALSAPAPQVDATVASSDGAPSESTKAVSPLVEGKVVDVRERSVIVDLGTVHGVKAQTRIEFVRQVGLDLGGGESTTREETIAVGTVTEAGKTRSNVSLGIDEVVPAGCMARITPKAATRSATYPPRAPGHTVLSLTVRPFFAIHTRGIGGFNEADLGHHFDEIPLYLGARFHPVTLQTFEGTKASVAASGMIGFDARLIGIQLGVGGATAGAYDDIDGKTVVVMPQLIRLGSIDGFSGELVNTFYYHHEFKYGGLRLSGRYPVTDEMWVHAAAEGTSAGSGFGEIGLRFLVAGNGGNASVFLTPTAGVATAVEKTGPMVGLGVEWRI